VDLADALAPLGDSAFDLSGFDWSTVAARRSNEDSGSFSGMFPCELTSGVQSPVLK
jgi:hypothetical protein